MAKGAIKGGKLDYSKAYKLLYGEKSPPKDIMFGRGATFGGFGDKLIFIRGQQDTKSQAFLIRGAQRASGQSHSLMGSRTGL